MCKTFQRREDGLSAKWSQGNCLIFFASCYNINSRLSIHDAQRFLQQIEKLEKSNEKLQLSRKKIQEALAKVQDVAKSPAHWKIT